MFANYRCRWTGRKLRNVIKVSVNVGLVIRAGKKKKTVLEGWWTMNEMKGMKMCKVQKEVFATDRR